ncbi:MAG: hypothetical protein KGL39_28370 [Patescibacteria group bacterium]|nr:hypothetical protein [Patescibacteria group bacterium]
MKTLKSITVLPGILLACLIGLAADQLGLRRLDQFCRDAVMDALASLRQASHQSKHDLAEWIVDAAALALCAALLVLIFILL